MLSMCFKGILNLSLTLSKTEKYGLTAKEEFNLRGEEETELVAAAVLACCIICGA